MNTRSARGVVNALQPGGARAFYMILGLAVAAFGLAMAVGLIGGNR